MSNIKVRSGRSSLFLSFCLIYISIAPLIYGQSKNPTITIKGNTRTTTSYLNSIVENCLENQSAGEQVPIDTQKVQECVLNTKLFSRVDVSHENDILEVEIQDRWTLIPVPIVVSEKGKDTSYGALLMENNFLGSGKKLVVGGTMSKTNNFMVLMVEDPSISFSDWSMKFMGGQSHKTLEAYEEDRITDGMDLDSRFYSTSLGYQFNNHFKSALQLSFNQLNFDTFEDYNPPEDVSIISAGLTAKMDFSNYRFYYQEGFSADLKYLENINRSDKADFTKTFALKMNWQMETFNEQALQFGFSGGGIQNADRRSAIRLGSKNGFRGVPGGGAWSKAYYALSTDYQIPVLCSEKGTWTIAPFIDSGFLIQQVDNKTVNYHSYGIGSYFFLKKIAIPGIGLIIGTNTEYQENFFKFTIGFDI